MEVKEDKKQKQSVRWNSEKHQWEIKVKGVWKKQNTKKRKLMNAHKPDEIDKREFMEAWMDAYDDKNTLDEFCRKHNWEGESLYRRANTKKDQINRSLRRQYEEEGVPEDQQRFLPPLSTKIDPMPFSDDLAVRWLADRWAKSYKIPIGDSVQPPPAKDPEDPIPFASYEEYEEQKAHEELREKHFPLDERKEWARKQIEEVQNNPSMTEEAREYAINSIKKQLNVD